MRGDQGPACCLDRAAWACSLLPATHRSMANSHHRNALDDTLVMSPVERPADNWPRPARLVAACDRSRYLVGSGRVTDDAAGVRHSGGQPQ